MSTKVKSALKERWKVVIAVAAILVAIALMLSAMLFNISNADEGVDIPNTKSDLKANGEEYLSIVAANLEYKDYFHIIYGVHTNLDDGEYSEVRMLFWNQAMDEYTYGTHSRETSRRSDKLCDIRLGEQIYEECQTFLSEGIAPKQIGDVIYARAYVTDAQGNGYYSNVIKYSVLDYVYSRYRDRDLTANVTDDQLYLYDSILEYGAKTQIILDYKTSRLVTSHAARIEVCDAHMTDGFDFGTFIVGDSVTLVADMDKTHGRFLHWEDPMGNIIGEERVLEIKVSNETVSGTYTAVYSGATKVSVIGGKLSDGATSGSFVEGTSYTLIADDPTVFKHWVDESGNVVATTPELTLTAGVGTFNKTYRAVSYSPSVITVTGGKVNGSESVTLAYGESYTVTATVPDGYLFGGWTKNGESVDLKESFTAIAGDGESLNYVASFNLNSGASFGGVEKGPLTSNSSITSDGYTITLEGSSDNFGAEIASDPKNPSNKTLKLNDADASLAGRVLVDVIGKGSFINFKSNIYFESFSTGSVLTVSFGNAYKLRFTAVEDKALKIYDVSVPDSSEVVGYLDKFVRPGEWFELSVILTAESDINGKAPRAFVFIDGKCVAESYNVANASGFEKVALTAEKATSTVVYFDEIRACGSSVSASEESAFDAERVFHETTTTSSDRLQNIEMILGKEAYEELKAMDTELFSESVYEWAASLYDPETGGFYFSISGRDNYGYLADIETTSQMSGVLNQLGIGSYDGLLNAEQKAAMLSWAQMLESNRDGYNYHPQWGISIGDSRRSRDYSYASTLYSASGSLRFKLYNDANYRLSGGASGSRGVTVPVEYDNSKDIALTAFTYNLKSPLGISVKDAVSKVILASSSTGESNTPVHLRSEEAFVGYINGKWNSGCTVSGTHERHLCTSSCIQVDDPNDSYMELKNGKVEFIRGKRCTSCHECKHSVGHSYGFASVIGTQNSQIASLGLGKLLVMYYYDVQENVQASLRQKVEDAYRANNGQYAWEALSNASRKDKAAAVTEITDAAKALAKSDYNTNNCKPGEDVFTSLSEAKKTELYKMAEAELIFVANVNANGSRIWASLTEEQKADLKRQNQNGIWEEQVTYGTISGLLKACGTPGAHGYEFLYAEDAIQSAIDCALFSVYDFTKRGEAVVSIYNPFNAINGVFGNIRNYGKDKTLVDRCIALVRSHAAELIENTTGKLKGYRMPDGGFSYSYSGYCVTSQGQPVAINGWNNGVGEGDVNGTALAFGTRSALLDVLGVSVTKVFSGMGNLIEGGYDLNGDGDVLDSFDLNGDGENEVFEATCTHSQRFKYLITTKEQIEKVDVNNKGEEFTYDFDNGVEVNGGEIVTESGSSNKVLQVIDDSTAAGASVYFAGNFKNGDTNKSTISFRMKALKCNNTTSHQIFVTNSSGGNILRIDMIYSNGSFSFTNVASKSTVLGITVNAKEWFTVDLEINPDGFNVGDTTYYGTFKVTQNGNTQSAYIPHLVAKGSAGSLHMYSLYSADTKTLYDDVKVVSEIKANVFDGEYHFDTVAQQIQGSDVLVDNPTTPSHDIVYLLNGNGASFAAYNYSVDDYTTNSVRYNFNSVQLGLLLSEAKAGDRIDVVMLDKNGKKITGIYLTVFEDNGNKLVMFHAPNGDVLEEAIPRTTVDENGKEVTSAELREMILDVNTAKWMTVKLEYHYDMATPQLDVAVRYSDDLKSGYYTTTAACLKDIDVCDNGADAYSFANLSIKATGKTYVDDLYIRNVYDPCDGKHVFIRKATKAFLTGETVDGHEVYFTSCQKCGAIGDETFTVHTFVRTVDAAYKISDATIYSPAVYKEHCTICGLLSEVTFTDGYPLDDPSKHNFSQKDENGVITKDDSIPDYLTYNVGGGKWSTVMEEKVGDVVNYYLNIGKDYYYVNGVKTETSGTNSVKFKYVLARGEAVADKYIYEFDFRWLWANEHTTDVIYAKVGCSSEHGSSGAFQSGKAGNYVNYHGQTFYSGDWHSLKYLFARTINGDGWELSVFIDGVKVHSMTFTANGVPYVALETRWPRTDGGVRYPNNMSFDIDRLKVTKIDTEGHDPVDIVATRYLKTPATCETPAVYYKSCSLCGEKLEDTFTVGSVIGHEYGNVLNESFIKTPANCENGGEYYKSCKRCGVRSETETFTVGSGLGHNDVKIIVTEATMDTAEVCYFACQRCGRTTEPMVNGEPLSWTFDKDAMPTGVTVAGFASGGAVPTEGLWARVLEEEVNGAVNHYLNVGKVNNGSTHSLTFQASEKGKNKYVYEFKFRWNSADDMRSDLVPILVKISAGAKASDGTVITNAYSAKSNNSGSQLTYYKALTATSGWHTIRYEFTANTAGDGWNYTISVDGTVYKTDNIKGTAAPKVLWETRYGEDVNGDKITDNFTNINFDIDNVYIKYE